MKYFLIVISFVLLISCKEKAPEQKDTFYYPPKSDDGYSSVVESEEYASPEDDGYMFINAYMDTTFTTLIWIRPKEDADKNLSNLKLKAISKEEFHAHDTTYNKLKRLIKEETDSTFSLEVKNEKWDFKKEPNLPFGEARAGKRWTEYIGYFPDLNLQLVRSCAVSGDLHGFADLFFINVENNKKYYFTGGDFCDGTPVLSPGNKYMAIVDTDWDGEIGYVHFISVIKVNAPGNSSEYLSYFCRFEQMEMNFDKIIWINDDEFVVRGYWEEQQKMNYNYYKASLPH